MNIETVVQWRREAYTKLVYVHTSKEDHKGTTLIRPILSEDGTWNWRFEYTDDESVQATMDLLAAIDNGVEHTEYY